MKVIVTGGGTGGHIYPALALIKEMKRFNSDAQFLYVGTENGLESDIVPRANIPFQTINISGFKRKISFHNVRTVWRFLRAIKRARKLIASFQADIVIGTGGYVAGPVVYAAAKMGVPTIIHEQNSVPGLTNKFLSRYVDRVAVSFRESASYFPKEKVVVTGNPRASEVIHARGDNPFEAIGLSTKKKTVVIVGGSRGARPINDAFIEALPHVKEKEWQFLYITGSIHYDKIILEVEEVGNPKNVVIKPFIHEMPAVLRHADLIVARAGATTLAEITALGLPAILIPSPYVTNNHQEKNAKTLSDQKAAILRKEHEINGKVLLQDIDKILSDEKKWKLMHQRSLQLAYPEAAQKMYQLMEELITPSK
ncbi:undecaprenyldiphospho-muramoylpentapeptide beta-N-acetylglucosaminyltransferase [Aliibacillus thermotolerans]|uniref:UDP-N-acetylglucosamine--N-acetylmuramyl-(pentapeptide) pyrophosphoryl-undecaprenol N-acetylglucosamine transferase n=1 Tax=Aliibacillus thermotolerans TaxID=1834418 RepID=A0ABW0U246_9BACI|nr:undecaprenyldiphospho-muramoylpentapeptide beta-N-acetylglucosaminyltransferase [Aliibacillus thermotolerans]MDA3131003.1 undecaprenyldiphospho-muramoylpentapeptide beta-N-acetylglucosaminyltransferase [Aliibacillus thermotolerans]